MKDLMKYNVRIFRRINVFLRKNINKKNRQRLKNRDFSLLCNNCNGGIISHDLGLQFRSPTVNMFFYGDHFFRFCENLEHYLALSLVPCPEPIHQPEFPYPVANLGDLELHFMHYTSFEQAKQKWEERSARLNRENLFVMWTFVGSTDLELMDRFEQLPFAHKVAFTERDHPRHKSAFYIRGFEEKGLGTLSLFDGVSGRRVIDQFDYVTWFNEGM